MSVVFGRPPRTGAPHPSTAPQHHLLRFIVLCGLGCLLGSTVAVVEAAAKQNSHSLENGGYYLNGSQFIPGSNISLSPTSGHFSFDTAFPYGGQPGYKMPKIRYMKMNYTLSLASGTYHVSPMICSRSTGYTYTLEFLNGDGEVMATEIWKPTYSTSGCMRPLRSASLFVLTFTSPLTRIALRYSTSTYYHLFVGYLLFEKPNSGVFNTAAPSLDVGSNVQIEAEDYDYGPRDYAYDTVVPYAGRQNSTYRTNGAMSLRNIVGGVYRNITGSTRTAVSLAASDALNLTVNVAAAGIYHFNLVAHCPTSNSRFSLDFVTLGLSTQAFSVGTAATQDFDYGSVSPIRKIYLPQGQLKFGVHQEQYNCLVDYVNITGEAISTALPYNTTRKSLPGTIRFADFESAANDLQVETYFTYSNTTFRADSRTPFLALGDGTPALALWSFNDGVYNFNLTYSVSVPSSSVYVLGMNGYGASAYFYFNCEIVVDGVPVSEGVKSRAYNIVQNDTVLHPLVFLPLPSGDHTLTFWFDYGYYLAQPSYLKTFSIVNESSLVPFSGGYPNLPPYRIEAEDFDKSDTGLHAKDDDSTNHGNLTTYRPTVNDGGVDLAIADDGRKYIANMTYNEAVSYSIYLPYTTASYRVFATVRRWSGSYGRLCFSVGGANPPSGARNTGWNPSYVYITDTIGEWTTLSATLTASLRPWGYQVLTLTNCGSGSMFDFDKFVMHPSTGPYTGVASPIPGTINMTLFDYGTAVDYQSGNSGNNDFRWDSPIVDISTLDNGELAIVDATGGDSLSYTVLIGESGLYDLYFTGAVMNAQHEYPLVAISIGMETYPKFAFLGAGDFVRNKWIGRLYIEKPAAGTSTTLKFSFPSTSSVSNTHFVGLTAFEFKKVSNPQPAPYRTGYLLSGIIQAAHYDYGGPGIAFYDNSPNSAQYYLRGGDAVGVTAELHVKYFTQTEWLHYTFSTATQGKYTLELRYTYSYSSYDAPVRVTLDGTTYESQATYGRTSVDLGNVFLGAGTHRLNFSFAVENPETNTTYAYGIKSYFTAHAFAFVAAPVSIEDPSCYVSQASAIEGCDSAFTASVEGYPSAETHRNQCKQIATKRIPWDGVVASTDGTLDSLPQCAFQTDLGRTALTLSPPDPTANSLLILFSRIYPRAGRAGELDVASVTSKDEILSFAIDESTGYVDILRTRSSYLRLTREGAVLYSADNSAIVTTKAKTATVAGLNISFYGIFFVSATGDRVQMQSGGQVFSNGYSSTTKNLKLVLDYCQLQINRTTTGAAAAVKLFNKDCPEEKNPFLNTITLHFSSGRSERAGLIEWGEVNSYIGYIRPLGGAAPDNVTLCESNPQYGVYYGEVPLVRGASESILSVTLQQHTNLAGKYTIHSTAWLKDSASCIPGVRSVSDYQRSLLLDLELQSSSSSYSTTYSYVSNYDECVDVCESEACSVFSYKYSSGASTTRQYCYYSTSQESSSSIPPLVDLTSSFDYAVTSIVAKKSWSPYYAAQLPRDLLSRPFAYPPSDGWSNIVFSMKATRVQIQFGQLSGFALLASDDSFASAKDWIGYWTDSAAAQCGPAHMPFLESRVTGRTAANCDNRREFVTCGSIKYAEESASQTVMIAASASALEGYCGTSMTAIILARGQTNIADPQTYAISPYPGWKISVTNPFGGSDFKQGPSSEAYLTSATEFGCIWSDSFGYTAESHLAHIDRVGCLSTKRTVEAALAACDSSASCIGYTTVWTPGLGEHAVCLVEADSELAKKTEANALYTFYRRRFPDRFDCTMTTRQAFSGMVVEAMQTGFAEAEDVLEVYVNGTLVRRCGGGSLYGFSGADGKEDQCGTSAVCFNSPVSLPAASTVRLLISKTVSSKGRCSYATAAKITFHGGFQEIVSALKGYNQRRVTFPTRGSVRTVRIPVKDVNTVALLITNIGTYTRSATTPRFHVELISEKNITRRRATTTANFDCDSGTDLAPGSQLTSYNCQSWQLGLCNGYNSSSRNSTGGLMKPSGGTVGTTGFIAVTYTPPSTTGSCLSAQAGSSAAERATLIFSGSQKVVRVSGNQVRLFYVAEWNATTTTQAAVLATINTAGGELFSTVPMTYTSGVEKYLETHTVYVYDVPTLDETLKQPRADGTGEFACIVDGFLDASSPVSCIIPAQGADFAVIRVAQTGFLDSTFSVTVTVGDRVVSCGRGRQFQGSDGQQGQCDLYLTCYSGSIPSGVESIQLTWSPPSGDVPCPLAGVGVALLENRGSIVLDCAAGELKCYDHRRCIPTTSICDGVYDCPDGIDEIKCNNWKLVSLSKTAGCEAIPLEGVGFSREECRNWAIAQDTETSKSLSFTYSEVAKTCSAFTCVEPLLSADESLESLATNVSAAYYMRIESFNDVGFCTDEYTCSGRGAVDYPGKPCSCTCVSGFIGTQCEVRKDMTIVEQLQIIINQPTLSAGELAQVVSDVGKQVRDVQLTVSGAVATDRWIRNQSVVTLQFLSGAFEAPTAERTLAILNVLEPQSQKKLGAALKNASLEMVEIAPPLILTIENTTTCFISNGTKSCTPEFNWGSYERPSRLVSLFITFQGLKLGVSESVAVSRNIDCSRVGVELDDTATEDGCKESTVCSYTPDNPKLASSLSIKPETSEAVVDRPCSTGIGDSATSDVLLVSSKYTYIQPLQKVTTQKGDEVSIVVSETELSEQARGASFFLIIFFALTFLASCCCSRGIKDDGKKLRTQTCCGFLAFIAAMVAVLTISLWMDDRTTIASHVLMIDEYRNGLCNRSAINPLPHRVSKIPADRECHRVTSLGTSEGASYAKVQCYSGKDEVIDGTAKVGVFRTEQACVDAKDDDLKTYNTGQCYSETDAFGTQTSNAQYFVAECYGTFVGGERFVTAQQDYSPIIQPGSTVSPRELESDAKVTEQSDIPFFIRDKKFSVPKFQRSENDNTPQLAATANKDIPDLPEALDKLLVVFLDEEKRYKPSATVQNSTASAISNTGLGYNNFDSPGQLSGKQAAQEAMRFVGIRETMFDIGKYNTHEDSDITVTFWMRANEDTRGFAFAAVDNWFTIDTFNSPIIERLQDIIENGQSAANYFDKTWHMYYGLYVNGKTRSIHMISAPPGGIVELVWNPTLQYLNVTKLFDNQWHFIALTFAQFASKRYAQIYIDGETSFVDQGWRQCFGQGETIPAMSPLEKKVNVFSNVEEAVERDAVLYLGYFNGGLYDFEIHKTALEHEKIIGLGAEPMKKHAVIDVENSNNLGYLMIGLAVIFFLVSVGQLIVEARRQSREFREEEKRKNEGISGRSVHVGSGAGSGLVATIPQFLHFAQSLGVYLSGWSWPFNFTINIAYILVPLSLDFNLPFVNVPFLVTPVLQFVVTAIVFTLMLYVSKKDSQNYREREIPRIKRAMLRIAELRARHEAMISGENNAGNGSEGGTHSPTSEEYSIALEEMEEADEGFPNPTTTPGLNWNFRFKYKGNPVIMEDELDKRELRKEIEKLIVKRPDSPMVSKLLQHRVKVKRMFGVDNGWLFYVIQASPNKKESWSLTVLINKFQHLSPQAKPNQAPVPAKESGPDSSPLTVIPDAIEVCPAHKEHLIASVQGVHQHVRVDGEFPYSCIVGRYRWYAKTSTKVRGCAGCDPLSFFVCPNPECGYCACTECAQLGCWNNFKAKIRSKMYQYRQSGILGAVGFMMILLVQIIYLPVMKTAIMILWCHPVYQCEFPKCYSEFTTEFRVALIYAAIAVIFLGFGLPYYFFSTVLSRKKQLIESGALDHLWPNGRRPGMVFAAIPQPDWEHILSIDNSMMKSLYDQFEFRYMMVQGSTLIFKVLLVLPIVFFNPNSLSQLLGAAAVEVAQLLFGVMTSAFIDHWVDMFGKFGSLCMITLLGFMSFHRAIIYNNPDSEGYAWYMLLCTAVYAVAFIFILIKVVVAPAIARALKYRREREMKMKQADAQTFEETHEEDEPSVPMAV